MILEKTQQKVVISNLVTGPEALQSIIAPFLTLFSLYPLASIKPSFMLYISLCAAA